MNIRRFVAADMREALARDPRRARRGRRDAVEPQGADGVEVIAAIDYDESLLGGCSRSAPAAAAAAALRRSARRRLRLRRRLAPTRPRRRSPEVRARTGPDRGCARSARRRGDGVAESGADELDEYEHAAAALRTRRSSARRLRRPCRRARRLPPHEMSRASRLVRPRSAPRRLRPRCPPAAASPTRSRTCAACSRRSSRASRGTT